MKNNSLKYNPKYIYKFYTPTIDNLNDIRNKKLWVADPNTFNDPLDCVSAKLDTLYFDMLKENFNNTTHHFNDDHIKIFCNFTESSKLPKDNILKKLNAITLSDNNKIELERIIKLTNDQHENIMKLINDKKYRITSFSLFNSENRIFDRLDMWSYYAQNSSGFCVAYNLNSIVENNEDLLKDLFNVKYSDYKNKMFKDKEKFIKNQLCKKSNAWKHEEEVRLIKKYEDTEKGKINFPYIEKIYIGCNASNSLKNELESIAKDLCVDLYQLLAFDMKMKTIHIYSKNGLHNFYPNDITENYGGTK